MISEVTRFRADKPLDVARGTERIKFTIPTQKGNTACLPSSVNARSNVLNTVDLGSQRNE